ncbi:MAG: lysophospholipid acyltransferase family protein [Micavibrio sp.]
MIVILRSTLFNIFFYGLTACACVLCLPALFVPRPLAMHVVHAFVHSVYFLERVFIGLDYEIRGLENLPKDGCYIVAAKHQSPYETMKLHILFKDPAIILKRELLKIPLWGKFLAKSDPIAIDRSSKESAQQIIDGAKRMEQQGRPIIIFPQGTRVYTWQTAEDKPYKSGVARMQENTGLTIVPLAMNTGVFWPRHSWLKWKGKVVFEFLPPILPGRTLNEVTQTIQQQLEERSHALAEEAYSANPRLPRQQRPVSRSNS